MPIIKRFWARKRFLLCLLIAVVLLLTIGTLNGLKPDVKNTDSQENIEHWIWQHQHLNLAKSSSGLVIMQGEYQLNDGQVIFIKKGVAPSYIKGSTPVRLLFRAYQLPPIDVFIKHIDYLIYHWKLAGTEVVGVQIDYDSPSQQLAQYRQYVSKLSERYGSYFMSITGLASWLADNMNGLNQFAGVIDYVAIQFYQFEQPIPQVEQYIKRLAELKTPYKIGVTNHVNFARLTFPANNYFIGKIIFTNAKAKQ